MATHSSGPREFQGLYSPWGCKESDTTEQLSHHKNLVATVTEFFGEYKSGNLK